MAIMSIVKPSRVVLFRLFVLALIATLVAGCGAATPTPPATSIPVAVQESSVLLTVAVPSFMTGNFTNELISAFESAHPGVKVSVVKVDASIPPTAGESEKHMAAVQKDAGDV